MTQNTITNPISAILGPHFTTSKAIGVYAEARFGIPSKNCVGLGVCKLELLSSVKSWNKPSCACHKGRVLIHKTTSDRLCFLFEKTSLSLPTIQQHFSSTTFVIHEDFQLTTMIAKQLGQTSYILRQGYYPIIDLEAFYKVIF